MFQSIFHIFLAVFISAGWVFGAQETPPIPLQVPLPPWERQEWLDYKSEMFTADADKFTAWAKTQIEESDKIKCVPTEVVRVFLSRAATGVFTLPFQSTPIENVILHARSESLEKGPKISEETATLWSRAFLKTLLSTAKLPSVRIAAGDQLAGAFSSAGLNFTDEEIAVRKKVIIEAEELIFQTSRILQHNRVYLGIGLVRKNKKAEADGYFLEAFGFPWYSVKNETGERHGEVAGARMQELKKYYEQSVMGLIETRRGDKNGLRDIEGWIAPASNYNVRKALQEAMEEAGGKAKAVEPDPENGPPNPATQKVERDTKP